MDPISIHAPREGCDLNFQFVKSTHSNFNPRTPRGVRHDRPHIVDALRDFNPRTPRGVRPTSGIALLDGTGGFQSTHPARGATPGAIFMLFRKRFQSTHPARGATVGQLSTSSPMSISIHAPREGCDCKPPYCILDTFPFQSTHPARGATAQVTHSGIHTVISIHAPREGCDAHSLLIPSTSLSISIHAPREGCDPLRRNTHPADRRNFNPRTPRGVRQQSRPRWSS